MFYDLVFKHGKVLSKNKMEIGKVEIKFLSFKIAKDEVILQSHILQSFDKFPDIITEKVQLQRFLGTLNYVRPFYKGLAGDIFLLVFTIYSTNSRRILQHGAPISLMGWLPH
jgi:hypothetical protein